MKELTPVEYAASPEKRKDFWLGFRLWWAINILLVFVILFVGVALSALISPGNGALIPIPNTVVACVPLLINIGLIIYLAFTRPPVAMGMLTAIAVAFGIVIILGVVFAAACFLLVLISMHPG